MLPLELLRVRTRKGEIRPVYADTNKENLDLAGRLLALFNTHIGRRKGDLLKKTLEIEVEGVDYKLVRGLSTILQRFCTFNAEAPVDPRLARRLAYEEASQRSPVITQDTRRRVLDRVALKLNISPEQLEKSLYADLEDELILKEFTPRGPAELLSQYNLSLTQTLMFRSTFMEIKVSSHWKEILRMVKFQGLMYSAESRGDTFLVTVDGPSSLFRFTQRYGTRLAKVLPLVVMADYWEIVANVVRAGLYGKRIFQLRLTSTQVGDRIRPTAPPGQSQEVAFDSLVEERFFRDFQSLGSGWKIVREPPPLIAGRHVLIPDFSFEKAGAKVYMEIAGFWTRKYIQTKLKKLQQLKGVDIIVAADEKHSCDRVRQLKGDVIFYKNKVPVRPIFQLLKNREEKLLQGEIERLDLTQLSLDGDVIPLTELASKHRVSLEALKRKLQGFQVDGYTLIGEFFVSDRKLQEIESKIVILKNPSLAQAISVLADEGMDNPYDILSALDYTIEWSGLDTNSSLVHKKQR